VCQTYKISGQKRLTLSGEPREIQFFQWHLNENRALIVDHGKTLSHSNKIVNFKDWVQCFSMKVVMNTCFLLKKKKIGADPFCCYQEKRKNVPLIPKNDVTEPKARLL